jgi:hypothetical protein
MSHYFRFVVVCHRDPGQESESEWEEIHTIKAASISEAKQRLYAPHPNSRCTGDGWTQHMAHGKIKSYTVESIQEDRPTD